MGKSGEVYWGAQGSGLLSFLMGMIPLSVVFLLLQLLKCHCTFICRDRVAWAGHAGLLPPLPKGLHGPLGWGSVPVPRCGHHGSSLEESGRWDGACGLLPCLPTYLHQGGLHLPCGRAAWWSVARACRFHPMVGCHWGLRGAQCRPEPPTKPSSHPATVWEQMAGGSSFKGGLVLGVLPCAMPERGTSLSTSGGVGSRTRISFLSGHRIPPLGLSTPSNHQGQLVWVGWWWQEWLCRRSGCPLRRLQRTLCVGRRRL